MRKHFLECDQCKKAIPVDQLRCDKDGEMMAFTLKRADSDGAVYKFDLCSQECLVEFSKTVGWK